MVVDIKLICSCFLSLQLGYPDEIYKPFLWQIGPVEGSALKDVTLKCVDSINFAVANNPEGQHDADELAENGGYPYLGAVRRNMRSRLYR